MREIFSFIRDIAWEEVFEFWRENEGDDSKWGPHAKKRGFDSWEEWRSTYVSPLKLNDRKWTLCRVTDPILSVPSFCGGPFNGWIENVYGDAGNTPTFEIIAQKLDEMKHEGVRSLLDSFPNRTTVIGVMRGDDIVIVEGMHRCAAIALAAAEGITVETELQLALGSELPGELPIVGGQHKGE